MLDFPTELVTKIFKSLVLAPLPTGTGLPRPADVSKSQRALVNQCLTSNICKEIALPLMYKHIIIINRVQMSKLLVSLLTHQDRGAWIRNISLLQDLVFQESCKRDDRFAVKRSRAALECCGVQNPSRVLWKAIEEGRTIIYKLYGRATFLNPRDLAYQSPGWNNLRWLFQRLLQIILYLGTNIDDILFTAPNDPPYTSGRNYHDIARLDLDYMTSWQFPPASDDQAGFGDTYKYLRRIRTQADPRCEGRVARLGHLVGVECLKSRQWEFLGGSVKWWPLAMYQGRLRQPSKYMEIFSHVTELKLHESKTHPAWLRRCLRFARSLKKFSYTTNAAGLDGFFIGIALPREEIDDTSQQALDEVRDTLTELRLGWIRQTEVLTEHEMATVAPHRVNVSGFPHLRNTDIDPPFLLHGN